MYRIASTTSRKTCRARPAQVVLGGGIQKGANHAFCVSHIACVLYRFFYHVGERVSSVQAIGYPSASQLNRKHNQLNSLNLVLNRALRGVRSFRPAFFLFFGLKVTLHQHRLENVNAAQAANSISRWWATKPHLLVEGSAVRCGLTHHSNHNPAARACPKQCLP